MKQNYVAVAGSLLITGCLILGCSSSEMGVLGQTDDTAVSDAVDADVELPADEGSAESEPPEDTAPVDSDVPDEPYFEPDSWQAPGEQDGHAFAWGVQLSDANQHGVMLSVRTRETRIHVKMLHYHSGQWQVSTLAQNEEVTDSVFQMEIENLQADSLHYIAVYSADESRRSRVTRFRTAVADGQSRIVRFGASSCLGGQNRPFPTLTRASEEKLDFFLLAGDTVYADTSLTFNSYRGKWEEALAQQGLRDLFASTSVIATWDDHEIANNWSWEDFLIEDRFSWARAAWSESIPWREGPGGTGIWRRLGWGDVLDVLVLDTRGERYDGEYISTAQMDWLKAWLQESSATFKIILNGVPITDMNGIYGSLNASDRWDGYAHQRSEILEHIADNNVQGVLWVSGDFHFGELGRVDPPGGVGHDLWEIFAGPAGSFVNPIAYLARENEQYKHILKTYTYTHFEADPDAGTIRVKFINDDGDTLVDETLQLVNP